MGSLPELFLGRRLKMRDRVEIPLNLAGGLVNLLLRVLPPDVVLWMHERVFRALASPHSYTFDPGARLAEARELAARVERETGRSPALLALISHPAVRGEALHFNFELVRHALRLLRAVRGAPCRPRLVVAVDPFAMDNQTVAVESLYAGCMGLYHVGIDRMAFARSACSSSIVGEAAWHRSGWRLLDLLRRGGEAGMALGGGVASTARLLYTAREWVWRERRSRPRAVEPGRVLEALRRDASFAAYEGRGLGPLSVLQGWRRLEGWFLRGIADDRAAPESGELGAEVLRRARLILDAIDRRGDDADLAIGRLRAEFKRETPPRPRLMRAVFGRVLRAGRPVLFIPVVHDSGASPGIHIRSPWAWARAAGDRAAGWAPDGRPWDGAPEEFGEAFVAANYA